MSSKPFPLPLRVKHQHDDKGRDDELSPGAEVYHLHHEVDHRERHEDMARLGDEVHPLPSEDEQPEGPEAEHQSRPDRHHGAVPYDVAQDKDKDARGAGVHRQPAVQARLKLCGEVERRVSRHKKIEDDENPSRPVPYESYR